MRWSMLILCLIPMLPVSAGDAQPPVAGTGAGAGAGESASAAARSEEWRARRDKYLVESVPELKGVDPNTAEGQAKIAEYREKTAGERTAQWRQGMKDMQTLQRQGVKKELGLSDEEWTIVEPLLTRVESLRTQRAIIDPNANVMSSMMRGMGGGGRGGAGGRPRSGGFDMSGLVSAEEMEPSVKDLQDGTKALKTLLADAQTKTEELTAAIAKVRNARSAFRTVYAKAQDELRGVLTRRQEALLIDQGILE